MYINLLLWDQVEVFCSSGIFYREIRELYTTPSVEDVRPISGYVTFQEDERTAELTVHSLDDQEEEADDVFAVKLLSAKGGARVADNDAAAILKGS